MKHKIAIILTALLCIIAIANIWARSEADGNIPQDLSDISSSAVHSDYRDGLVRPTRIVEETTEETTEQATTNNDEWQGSSQEYIEPTEWVLSRETIINTAYELYGVSEEWTMWLIGTTWNEGYQQDRYLEYCWACEIVNVYRGWSVYDLDGIWGSYYSIGHAFSGYYNADDVTLEMVYEALVNRDTRIVEVDGMIDYYVPNYYLIYDSPIYNCQVWGS